jgi:hypothetical protein
VDVVIIAKFGSGSDYPHSGSNISQRDATLNRPWDHG